MNKKIFALIGAVAFVLFSFNSVADTKILSQSIRYRDSSEIIQGHVKQGERIEIKLTILSSERKNTTFFTRLEEPIFFLGEDKLTENPSLEVELSPGTHNIRVLGKVGNGNDNDEIILLGSDSMSEYIRARIESPYILKEEAYLNYLIIGILCVFCTCITAIIVIRLKGGRSKSSFIKSSNKNRKKVRELLKVYFQNVAGTLNNNQKQGAKTLVNQIDEVLKWQ